ncbi:MULTISPECIES: sodium/solute symporter [unclassified Paludibacterium]|uniref:sodium:solute symporter family transporter n=1 Tax=unclassified Paludibacterium TaxID=2618429 RepID=UPI001C04FDEA|nr:sodium/solute symporter [Paludibacterium sp. B53371]BEV73249.1 cation acetate symporter [Paludibacterium sp. THUN1379]
MNLAQFCVLLLLVISLSLTLWASRRTHTRAEFYTAGGRIRAWQNGLALAGDYLSAAAFLGAAGLFMSQGYDSLIYAVGTLAGWPLLLLLFAEKLRERARFTLGDVLAERFGGRPVRAMAAFSTLLIVLFYLVVQLVGAGKLLGLLFGLAYLPAVLTVAALTMLYVALGGMLATTWVQIVKACLLLACGLTLALGVLIKSGFSTDWLITQAEAIHPAGHGIWLPSQAMHNPWEVLSLGLGLVLGLLGLPHVLMRFFTVPDARAARASACWATAIVALFFTLNVLIGVGSIVFVSKTPAFLDAHGKLLGGGNMAVLHLAQALGGAALRDVVAAVVFATIMAVVAGLTVAGSSALSHDIYGGLLCRGKPDERRELQVSRGSVLLLVLLAVLLSCGFQNQNIAILFGLAFGMAASGPFPILLLTLFWPGLTARGAIAGGLVGLLSATLLIIAGPAVWVAVLGHARPLFPLASPALCSVPLAFLTAWLVSRLPGTPE